MGSLVSASTPLSALIADTVELPQDPVLQKAATAPTHREPKKDEEELHWIEIEMVDEDNKPVAGEKYQIELPDGKITAGTTYEKGVARINGIKNPGMCKITFPNLDKDAWERV